MKLTELKYLIAVAREKHFGKAAAHCHISQPSLSIAISKLEAELGVQIFERDYGEIRITNAGKVIIAQAQRAIEETEKIKTIAQAKNSQIECPLKIGAIYTIAPYLLPHLIPKLKKIAPLMPLIIQEDYTANLKTKLQQGELDAIFISLPFAAPNFVVRPLYDEPFVALMPKNHKLAKKQHLDVTDIQYNEMLLLGEGHCFRNQVTALFTSYDPAADLQQAIEGASLETLRHMVASGAGITILPTTATQINFYKNVLCTKPFKKDVPQRRIALAWRASFPRPKAIEALIQALISSNLHGTCLLP